jgi:DNA polymerase III delta subunit
MGETIPRVAVFLGGDVIGRRVARDAHLHAIEQCHGQVDHDRFDPAADTLDAFVERMITPSLFQSVRVFSLRHADALSQRDAGRLAEALTYDIPDVYLVIDIDEGTAKSGAKMLKSLGVKALAKKNPERIGIYDFAKPPDYKMAEWLCERVPELFGRRLSRDDADYLVDLVGTELEVVYSELQKMDIHLEPRAPVDRAAIDAITGASRSMSAFELARALSAKDLPRSLAVVESLFSATFYAPSCLSVLFRHFWAIRRIRAYGRANPDAIRRYFSSRQYKVKNGIAHEIGVAAGLLRPGDPPGKAYPMVIKSQIVEQARTFGDRHLESIFRWLRDFDVGVKTGRIDPTRHAVELLCYRIVRVVELEREQEGSR